MLKEYKQELCLTRDARFQIGARRTFSIDHEDAWSLLTSKIGIAIWLGESPDIQFARGHNYQFSDGTIEQIQVFKLNSHLRITWQPLGWRRSSTIQLRVIPRGHKTVIAFHQEHLPDS